MKKVAPRQLTELTRRKVTCIKHVHVVVMLAFTIAYPDKIND